MCNCESTEDEFHFLIRCASYSTERNILHTNIGKILPGFDNSSQNDAFIIILKCENKEIQFYLAKWAFAILTLSVSLYVYRRYLHSIDRDIHTPLCKLLGHMCKLIQLINNASNSRVARKLVFKALTLTGKRNYRADPGGGAQGARAPPFLLCPPFFKMRGGTIFNTFSTQGRNNLIFSKNFCLRVQENASQDIKISKFSGGGTIFNTFYTRGRNKEILSQSAGKRIWGHQNFNFSGWACRIQAPSQSLPQTFHDYFVPPLSENPGSAP